MNKCGECRACCIYLEVDELEKPQGVACKHLCASGCSIYKARPESCSTFNCLYLSGFLSERPDKSGHMAWIKGKDIQLLVLPGFKPEKRIVDQLLTLTERLPVNPRVLIGDISESNS
jgi:hypothetical protein